MKPISKVHQTENAGIYGEPMDALYEFVVFCKDWKWLNKIDILRCFLHFVVWTCCLRICFECGSGRKCLGKPIRGFSTAYQTTGSLAHKVVIVDVSLYQYLIRQLQGVSPTSSHRHHIYSYIISRPRPIKHRGRTENRGIPASLKWLSITYNYGGGINHGPRQSWASRYSSKQQSKWKETQ